MSCSLGAEVGVAVGSRTSAADTTLEHQTLEPLSLVVVCAWCGRPIGRGAVSNHRLVSHGICRPCSDNVLFSESSDLLLRR
jgi:hypothetical protein